VAEVLAVALGAEHRQDPVLPRTGGPAGNAQLTAWSGLVLLALFLAESATLLALGSLISWHIVIGTVLTALALLKTATTGWRILRYYTGDPTYRQAGPPPLILRMLGPFVILTALAALGSGLALIALGTSSRDALFTAAGFRVDAVTVHQGTVLALAVALGLHSLTRIVPALRLAAVAPRARRVPGGGIRIAILAATLLLGAVASVVVLDLSDTWTRGGF
jgi:hypothetical protein